MKLYFDKRVYIAFLLIFFISLITCIKICNPKDIVLTFSIPDSGIVQQPIKFADSTQGAESWEWNFGDGSDVSSYLQSAEHTYANAGLYTVTITVNEKISAQKEIRILEGSHNLTGGTNRIKATLNWHPRTPNVGQKIQFKDQTPDATAWEWRFDNDATTSDKQNPVFIFKKKGAKSVRLKVIGNNFDIDTVFTVRVIEVTNPAIVTVTTDKQTHLLHPDYNPTTGKNVSKATKVSGSVKLEISEDKKSIYAVIFAKYLRIGRMGGKDTRNEIDNKTIKLYTAPKGKRIHFLLVDDQKLLFEWPSLKLGEVKYKAYAENDFVKKIEVTCTKELKDSPFTIYFNDFEVELMND